MAEAIESALRQTYPKVEVVVIDDGSTDNTKEVAARYPSVKYVFQHNQGLSAARNAGVRNSAGEYLVFLDADDLLYEGSLSCNLHYLFASPAAAFVSGSYDLISANKKILKEGKKFAAADYYLLLLKGNYITVPATVMYRRWVFDAFSFDTALKSCEDYDLYLKVTRKHPVLHHNKKVAAYRVHGNNMSGNVPRMLATALQVLLQEEANLQTAEERAAYQEGLEGWKDFYSRELYSGLGEKRSKACKEALQLLWKYNPRLYIRYLLIKLFMHNASVKKLIPGFGWRLLNRVGIHKKFLPQVGNIQLGDLNRTTPFSTCFGYDRGGPVDRYYIESFLEAEAASIMGRVLEIGDNEYTMRFGGDKVRQSDILHVNDSNPAATIIGDLSHAPQIPDNYFDCIILTQTLHLVYDFKAVIQTCSRILKPGGSLLLTVPGITPIDKDEWEKNWLWSFTGRVMEKILAEVFPVTHIEVNTYGNVFVATAFLYGMGLPELQKEQLDVNDSHYQVIITCKAVKPA